LIFFTFEESVIIVIGLSRWQLIEVHSICH
jgi:hypothetical protein